MFRSKLRGRGSAIAHSAVEERIEDSLAVGAVEESKHSARDERARVITWMRLARVYHRVDRGTSESLRLLGLSVAQFDVLAQVGAAEGMSQQELAGKLLVTKGNVCQLLDRLEERGWVERRPVRFGRGNLLFLTPSGRAVRERVLPEHEANVAARFAALSSEELGQLGRLLRKIDRSL